MAAAVCAAGQGAQVYILEANAQLGKKLLITGNGKCNFTNADMRAECYRSDSIQAVREGFIGEFLGDAGCGRVLSFLKEEIGILPAERNGCYYPYSGQARTVADAFCLALRRRGVQAVTNARVTGIRRENSAVKAGGGTYCVEFVRNVQKQKGKPQQQLLSADCVILAAGSCAYPKTGSDGSGYLLARRLGLKVNPWHTALVPLCAPSDAPCLRQWAGIRTNGTITIIDETGAALASETGELQLTEYGVSGIPSFQVSRFVSAYYPQGKQRQQQQQQQQPAPAKLSALLDFLPALSERELCALLAGRRERKNETLSEAAGGLLNQKLMDVLIQACGVSPELPAAALTQRLTARLARQIKAFPLPLTGTKGYDMAQVCAGGVALETVDPRTMQVREASGLYVAGELLDLDGMCGGYNLHAAFLSGMRAGCAAADRKYGRDKTE